MLYCFEDFSELPSGWLERVLPILSEQRKERVLAYAMPKDRRNSALGYLLLCYGLRREYGITELPTFVYEKKGKPRLAEDPEIHFSISHCTGCVACALSESEVGLDVQDIRPVSDAVIRRVCNPLEQSRIWDSEQRETMFASFWSVKESIAKLLGCGISTDFKHLTLPEELRAYQIYTTRQRNYFITISSHLRSNKTKVSLHV